MLCHSSTSTISTTDNSSHHQFHTLERNSDDSCYSVFVWRRLCLVLRWRYVESCSKFLVPARALDVICHCCFCCPCIMSGICVVFKYDSFWLCICVPSQHTTSVCFQLANLSCCETHYTAMDDWFVWYIFSTDCSWNIVIVAIGMLIPANIQLCWAAAISIGCCPV